MDIKKQSKKYLIIILKSITLNFKSRAIFKNIIIFMIQSLPLPQQQTERVVRTFLNQLVTVSKHELNITLPGLASSFEVCYYGKKNQGKDETILDPTVRNCQKSLINGDKFDSLNSSLSSAFQLSDETISENTGAWTILLYQNGHFVEHIDFQRPLEGYVHIANQILIPPQSKCRYQGGCLKTWDGVRRLEIHPDERLWTRVVIPHGVPHSVENVSGTRITYMKPVYVVKKQGHSYENPNQDYEGGWEK